MREGGDRAANLEAMEEVNAAAAAADVDDDDDDDDVLIAVTQPAHTS